MNIRRKNYKASFMYRERERKRERELELEFFYYNTNKHALYYKQIL